MGEYATGVKAQRKNFSVAAVHGVQGAGAHNWKPADGGPSPTPRFA